MNNINSNDVINAFKDYAFSFGVTLPNNIQADGQLHRFATPDDKNGKTSGAYTLHLDGKPAGYFQDWRGEKQNWTYQGDYTAPIDKATIQANNTKKEKALVVDILPRLKSGDS